MRHSIVSFLVLVYASSVFAGEHVGTAAKNETVVNKKTASNSSVQANTKQPEPTPAKGSTLAKPVVVAKVKPRPKDPFLKYAFEVTPRYFVGTNDINQTMRDPGTGERSVDHYLAPSVDSDYASLYLHAGFQAPYRAARHSGAFHLELDTGEIYRGTITKTDANSGESIDEEAFLSNEQTLSDEFADNFFVRQFYWAHTFGAGKHVTLALGKGNPVIGHGLIYNDYSPYARVRLASQKLWTHPVQLEATVLFPSEGFLPEQTLIGNLEIALKHAYLGRFSLFAAHMIDRSDSVAESFRQVITASSYRGSTGERSLLTGKTYLFNRLTTFSSTSDVSWLGGGYTKYWSAGHSIWANGCFSLGAGLIQMDMSRFLSVIRRGGTRLRDNASGEVAVDMKFSGAAGQMGGSIFIKGDWYLSGFAVALSGDEGLDGLREFLRTGLQQGEVSDRFGAFLSVVPYLEHTSIFFNGGLDQGFSNRRSTLAGLAGRGVLAAGLSFVGTVWGPLSYQGGPAILQAMHDGPHGRGDLYGVELDNILTLSLAKGLTASLEVDFLHTGDFFPGAAWNSQTTVQMSYAPTGQL